MSSPVAETLVSLKRGLAGVGRGWYLFGAQAARVYGSCPLCSDIDATLVGSALQPSALLSRLGRAGFELGPDLLAQRQDPRPLQIHVGRRQGVRQVEG